MRLAGRCLVLGDDISTDHIIAGKYCRMADPDRLAPHALEGIYRDFARRVERDAGSRAWGRTILVAGRNFGCGSSREQAPLALRAAGVSAVVAESFGRIFFRNCINIGLPVMKCAGVRAAIRHGDRISVDLTAGELVLERGGRRLRGERLPRFMMEILEDGGLVPHIRRRLAGGIADGSA
jgi:3-isopropylmalate/(R)-2-methylmalate dehydratase small subunit